MMVSQIVGLGRPSHPREMSGREGKHGTHHKLVRGSNAQESTGLGQQSFGFHIRYYKATEMGLRRYLGRPDGAVTVASQKHVRRYAGDMVDQTKVGCGQDTPLRFRANPQLREGEDAGPLPIVNVLLGFGGVLEIRFPRTPRRLLGRRWKVPIITPATVFRTVATAGLVQLASKGLLAAGGFLLTTVGNSHHIGYVVSYRFCSPCETLYGSVEFCPRDQPWMMMPRTISPSFSSTQTLGFAVNVTSGL